MLNQKMSVAEREAEKHQKDTFLWMRKKINNFTEIMQNVSIGVSVEEYEEELRIIYKLKQLDDKLTKD